MEPNVTVAGARLQAMKEAIMSERNPLRVASIVLPTGSARLLLAHTQLKANLLAHWGGYTSTVVDGAWKDEVTQVVHHDYSRKYDVAMRDTFTDRTTFRAIARVAGMEGGELAVFVVHADGGAEIIDIDSSEANDKRALSRDDAMAKSAEATNRAFQGDDGHYAQERADSTTSFHWMEEAINDAG